MGQPGMAGTSRFGQHLLESPEDAVPNTDTFDMEQGRAAPDWIQFLRNNRKSHFVIKFAVPAMVNGLCIFLSMWMLHIATYYYVLYMDRLESDYAYAPHGDQHEFSGPGGALSPGLTPQNVSYGSLIDVPESFLPWWNVQLSVLDAVSAAMPCLWGIGTLYSQDLILWTKVMGCNAMLALGKGFIGCITIVPDSIGWTNCKARLKPENVDFLRDSIPNPFEKGQFATYVALLKMEVFGKQGIIPRGAGMRYCADMMYSGHTYFTCLYALGLLELLKRLQAASGKHGSSSTWKSCCFYTACVVIVAEQCLEISLVLLNRFHYTSDVFVAILVTLLWYTNAPVVICARWWDGSFKQWRKEGTEGYLWIPGLCFPFCGFAGYHELSFRRAKEVVSADQWYLKGGLVRKVLYHAFCVKVRGEHGLVIGRNSQDGKFQLLHADPGNEFLVKEYEASDLYFGMPDPRLWLWTIAHWHRLDGDAQRSLTKAFDKKKVPGDKDPLLVQHNSQTHVVVEKDDSSLTLCPAHSSGVCIKVAKKGREGNEAKPSPNPKLSDFIKVLTEKRLGEQELAFKKRLEDILVDAYIPGHLA